MKYKDVLKYVICLLAVTFSCSSGAFSSPPPPSFVEQHPSEKFLPVELENRMSGVNYILENNEIKRIKVINKKAYKVNYATLDELLACAGLKGTATSIVYNMNQASYQYGEMVLPSSIYIKYIEKDTSSRVSCPVLRKTRKELLEDVLYKYKLN